MKMTNAAGALALALIVAIPGTSEARTHQEATQVRTYESPHSKAKVTSRSIPFHGRIGNIDVSGRRFTLMGKDGQGRPFAVTGRTLLTDEGKAVKFSALRKGEEIRGAYWVRPDGTREAKVLRVGPASVAEPKSKLMEKKEKKQNKEEPIHYKKSAY